MRDCFQNLPFRRAVAAVICWYVAEPIARQFVRWPVGERLWHATIPACLRHVLPMFESPRGSIVAAAMRDGLTFGRGASSCM